MAENCQGCDRVTQYIDGIIVTEPSPPMAVMVMLIDADGGVHSLQRTRSDMELLGRKIEIALDDFFNVVNGAMGNDPLSGRPPYGVM